MALAGSYVLLVDLEEAASVRFGAAGSRRLRAGRYAYVGSARGAGGFARLERHRGVARGARDVRHWHIDLFRLPGGAEAALPCPPEGRR